MKKLDTKPLISTSIILDTRRPKVDGVYPVKLRVTYLRIQKYYNLKFDFTKEEFEKIMSQRPRAEQKETKLYFETFEKRAIEVIDNMEFFTYDEFENKFFQKYVTKDDVFKYYENYIQKLRDNNQIGNASIYETSKNSIKKFIKKDKLSFKEITAIFLNDYEKFMKNQGRSYNTISIDLRCLRKLYNDYIENNELQKNKSYPFGKSKYQIPQSENVKKALKISDLKKIFEYSPIDEKEEFAVDMFILSYLCNGINISDILRLKFKNIDKDKIYFIREKTKNTTKNSQKKIEVLIDDKIKSIIEKWGNKEIYKDNYIFTDLTNEMTEVQKKARIQQTTKNINKYLKRIGEKLELELKLTTYVARHSFATVLKRKGVSTEFISESLGHSSLKTTQNYLDSFEDDTKREFMKLLTDFD